MEYVHKLTVEVWCWFSSTCALSVNSDSFCEMLRLLTVFPAAPLILFARVKVGFN